MTPESLRAQVNVLLDAERRMLEADLPKQAAWVRREAEKLRRAAHTVGIAIEERGLSRETDPDTIETMNATEIVSEPRKRRRGVKPNPKRPVGKVADALGMSIAELAKATDEKYESLRTWNARNTVPADLQKKFDAMIEAHRKAQKSAKKPG